MIIAFFLSAESMALLLRVQYESIDCRLKNRWKTVRSSITRAGAECRLSSHALLASDNFFRRVGIELEPDAELADGRCPLPAARERGIHALHGNSSCCRC
jgi:hypothetical protein